MQGNFSRHLRRPGCLSAVKRRTSASHVLIGYRIFLFKSLALRPCLISLSPFVRRNRFRSQITFPHSLNQLSALCSPSVARLATSVTHTFSANTRLTLYLPSCPHVPKFRVALEPNFHVVCAVQPFDFLWIQWHYRNRIFHRRSFG